MRLDRCLKLKFSLLNYHTSYYLLSYGILHSSFLQLTVYPLEFFILMWLKFSKLHLDILLCSYMNFLFIFLNLSLNAVFFCFFFLLFSSTIVSIPKEVSLNIFLITSKKKFFVNLLTKYTKGENTQHSPLNFLEIDMSEMSFLETFYKNGQKIHVRNILKGKFSQKQFLNSLWQT